mgnify:CR=1 FL=1
MEKDQKISLLEWHLEAGAYSLIDEKPQDLTLSDLTSQNIAQNQQDEKNTTNATKAQNTKQVIENCNNLSDLKNLISRIETFNIKKTAKNMVFGSGNENGDIMVIGEAPGSEEDDLGMPFVGAAGKLLDKMLHSIEISRSEVYVTNVLPWRPPANRKPTPSEIEVFLPYLLKHIDLIDPKIVILLGGTAASAILNLEEGITKLRGKWHKFNKIDVMPMYHPAYLLRQPSQKKQAWADLLEIKNKLINLI